jgi:hypothetical protein
MEKVNKKVVMINQDGEAPISIRFSQFILGCFRLGREIKVSPKANACFNKGGYKIHYYVDSVSICVGIGNDHTAELSMTKSAWNALMAGEKIHITTTEEFKKKYVYPTE